MNISLNTVSIPYESASSDSLHTEVKSTPPVIIIGMHRSGTSLLTRILEQFGVFVGSRTNRNQESYWMNSINYWLFRQGSSTWERPEGVDNLLAQPEICNVVQDYIQGIVSGPASIGYLGPAQWIKYRSLFRISRHWGWKDPRNTYTLPIWLRVFPGARIIHIKRHGVDVAQSLRVRHQQAAAAAAARYRKRRWLYKNNPFAPKRSGFAHAPKVAQLDQGFELWKSYTQRAKKHVQNLGEKGLEIRYEDLLREPLKHLPGILDFCGLEVSRRQLEEKLDQITPERAFAYQGNPELVEFANKVSDYLAELGYQDGS